MVGLTYPAAAQNLGPPPSGLEILDLAGQPIVVGAYATYSADFVATSTESDVTFAIRQDPAFVYFTGASVVDTGGGPNLFQNGNFNAAGATPSPGAGVPDWNYWIEAGNLFPQYLGFQTTDPLGGGAFYDGSTQAYDGIDQSFPTTVGDTYDVSFAVWNTGANVDDYQDLSNNGDTTDTGGNGIDIVVYAGNAIAPTSAPDGASTLGLLGAVAASLAALRRKLS